MGKNKRILLLVIFAGVLLAGCAQADATLPPTQIVGPTPTQVPQPTATPNPEPMYQRGLQFYDDRAYEKAVEAFTEVLVVDPGRSMIYLDRALAYYMAGDMENALEDVDRALELGSEPESAAYFVKRGRCYMLIDELEHARADFDSAIDLDPDFAEAYVRRAYLYIWEGAYDQALEDLEVALAINPDYSLALTKQGIAFFYQGYDERAIAAFDRAIQLDPGDFEAYFFRGSVKAVKREYQAAIADFDRSIELYPVYNAAYLRRGNTYDDMGDFEAALVDYARAVELEPDYYDTYLQRGIAYFKKGEYGLAIADFDRVIELEPGIPESYNHRGRAYAILGLRENAISDVDKAIGLAPEYAYSHYLRGLLKIDEGDLSTAISELETAIELGLEPDLAQYAEDIITNIGSEADSQVDYGGYWSGNTSQGDVLIFVIEEEQIVALEVGFSGAGCETLAPFQVTNIEYPLDTDQFFVEGGGAVLTGTFQSKISAFGSLEFDCGDGVRATWTAAKDAYAAQKLSVDELARMPTVDIPLRLFSPMEAKDNLDEGIRILGSAGDWLLVREWVTDFPIPMGWRGTVYINATEFSFAPDTSSADPVITQQISLDCQTKTGPEEAVRARGETVVANPAIENSNVQVVDDDKAYLLLTTLREGGDPGKVLILASRNSHDCYSYMDFSVDEDSWEDYFPLIQAIVQGWYDNQGKWLGVSLPDDL